MAESLPLTDAHDPALAGDTAAHGVEPTHGWGPAQVGMLAFLASEVAFFSTLIVAYLIYWGKSATGPQPDEVLRLPLAIANTLCLVVSSYTMHRAIGLTGTKDRAWLPWWIATIALGGMFLCGTAIEWRELIEGDGLTISTNLFGTTFFTLVGFHAAHVTIGVGLLTLFAFLMAHPRFGDHVRRGAGPELVSWYWHFVDVVWLFVFVIVYLVAR